eukprot:913590-Pleurochrysis_carterae.AAC.1
MSFVLAPPTEMLVDADADALTAALSAAPALADSAAPPSAQLNAQLNAPAPLTAPLLTERKLVALGTQPISLVSFWVGGVQSVFACSDRPAIVHSGSGSLLYSSVNLDVAAHMTPFASESMVDCLAIAAEDALIIGTIDEVRKLHIRTVPLGEQPRRICHVEAARAFAVLTTSIESSPVGDEVRPHAMPARARTCARPRTSPSQRACSRACTCVSACMREPIRVFASACSRTHLLR